jgi:hypothetical protein
MKILIALAIPCALFAQSARTTNYKPNIPGVANGVNVEDMLLAGRPNVIAFAGADPTGLADSTAAIQACVNYGEQIGAPCYLPMLVKAIGRPAAMYRIATFVTLPAVSPADIQLMGIVGDGSTQIGSPTSLGRGTQIYCSATYGTTGDPSQGCIRYDAVSFALPTFIFENLTFRGPDNPFTTTTSGDAIRIDDHGVSSGRVHMRNVLAEFFLGVHTTAFSFNGPEDNQLDSVTAVYVNTCSEMKGAFNDTTINNFACAQYVEDGSYVEGSQNIVWNAPGWQSGKGTGLHMRGVIATLIQNPHFEGNATSCIVPLQALWGAAPVVSAAAAMGATSVTLSGLGTGIIPSGSTINITTPGFVPILYTTVGTSTISGGSATLTLTVALSNAVTAGSTIGTPCTNKEANVVIEAGYTGAGCDSHGRHCGYLGGYNEEIKIDHPVMNSVYGIGSPEMLIAFANPIGSDGSQYANVTITMPGPQRGGIDLPLASVDNHTLYTNLDMPRNNAIDTGGSGTTSCFNSVAADDCPIQSIARGSMTLNSNGQIGNNNVLTMQDTINNPQQMFIWNHYLNPGVNHLLLLVGYETGINSPTVQATFDLLHNCVAIARYSCAGLGTYNFETPSINTTDLFVNGNHSINSGNVGTFAAGSTVGGIGIAKFGVATNATTPSITCTSTSSAVPIGGGTPTITTTCSQSAHTHSQN